jgi:hypothetical protein
MTQTGSQTRICSFGRYRVVQSHYPPIWPTVHLELERRSKVADPVLSFTNPDYFNVEYSNHFLCRVPPMLLQFSVFPPLSKSPLEVSDVRPNSQSSSVRVKRRMVLR